MEVLGNFKFPRAWVFSGLQQMGVKEECTNILGLKILMLWSSWKPISNTLLFEKETSFKIIVENLISLLGSHCDLNF